MAGALAGIRVVELATGVAGPYCGRLLAGLGAEVIKVEPPEGDSTRRRGPFPGDIPHPEKSGLFLHLNAGKRGPPSPPGPLSRLREGGGDGLLEWADVLLLSHQRRDLEATGLAELVERVAKIRSPSGPFRHSPESVPADESLIVVNVTPFGMTGPYADYRGGELIEYALGGYAMLTGSPDREPLKAYGDLVQYQAGAQAALGALAAVRARELTGRGQVVDVSCMEAATFLLGGVEQEAYFFGRAASRNGTRLVGFPAHHPYPSTIRPCADGYVHCHTNNRHLDLLGAFMESPRLLEPDLLAAMNGHADEIDAIMDAWLATRTRRDVVEHAQVMRLPFTEVMAPGEVLADEHHRLRGSFVEVDHPAAGRVLQPGAPIRMSATPWTTGPAPTLAATAPAIGTDAAAWTAGPGDPAPPPVRSGTSGPPGTVLRPLSGVRVIDFTNAVAGPVASSILGALGADVIKVEPPRGRPRRAAGTAPLAEGAEDRPWDRVLLFNCFNHGKRSLVLDVTQPKGRDVFLRLAATADVVVQNFAPRVLPNLGLDYEALRAANARIVLVSMPAFGLDGTYRDRISYGPGIDAMSGLSHLTGYEDGPPMKPGNFFCDQNAAVHTAFATLAALRHRERTGDGQHVELAMIEGEFQLLADAYLDWTMNGRERRRTGNAHPEFAPHGIFRCAGEDAWVAIAVEDDAMWRALCNEIGSPALAEAPRFTTAEGRKAHEGEIAAAVEAWTRGKDHYAVQERLQRAGVPAGAALDALELLRDPHVLARGGFEYVETAGGGPTPYPRVAFRMSGTPVPLVLGAPPFGNANEAVLDELGVTAGEREALYAEGVLFTEPAGGGH